MRIEGKVEEYSENDQYGFRRQTVTRGTILGLLVLIEKQIKKNKTTYLAFKDLEKNIQQHTINEVKVKLIGLNIGVIIGGQNVSMIRFADDIVMIADSEGGIQRAVDKMTEIFRILEMKINSKKMKILVCTKDPKIKAKIYIGRKKLEQVEEMVYLGSKITYNCKSTRETKQRISLAKIAVSKKHKLFTSTKLLLNIKKGLIKTYVWSVAAYGSETWAINNVKKKNWKLLYGRDKFDGEKNK
ncbi:Reverse transcriptase domain [Cinara cedri]|uniref:Reverse transcriptase domain n=1 Tax=Cinara cedri TaxID=506608 RepID=A0A5E4NIW3_9HEMI|nr:Reverse transcriptase domain [Cinara cedri]